MGILDYVSHKNQIVEPYSPTQSSCLNFHTSVYMDVVVIRSNQYHHSPFALLFVHDPYLSVAAAGFQWMYFDAAAAAAAAAAAMKLWYW